MHVLVTRARDEAQRTAEKLTLMGHTPILSPVLEMHATQVSWPSGVIDAVIATSAQAFELLHVDAEWPRPEARRLLPLFVVGEKTMIAARHRGFEGPTVIAPDARELAERILARNALPARVIYLAGHDRKSALEERLSEAGLGIEAIEVYEARAAAALDPAALDHLRSEAGGAVLHYSRRSAEIFLRLVRAAEIDPARLLHFAISEDAARPLRSRDLPHIAVAAEPSEAAILALLEG